VAVAVIPGAIMLTKRDTSNKLTPEQARRIGWSLIEAAETSSRST
jgi:hypothetical protein